MLVYPLPPIHPAVVSLLRKLRTDLIVIGSVARGNKPPGDLDLWINCDGYVGGEERYRRHQVTIKASRLRFESVFPTNWTFMHYDYPPLMVELIGTPNIDKTFAQVKRRSREEDISGVMLRIAPAEYAGASTK